MFPNMLFSPIQPFPIPPRQGLTLDEERSILQAAVSSSSTSSTTRSRHEPPSQRRRHALHGSSGSGHPKDPPPHSPEVRPEAQRAMFHAPPLSPAAAMAAAAAASSAARHATLSQAGTSQSPSSVPSLYPTHFVPRPMFQGLPLSSVPSTAAAPGVSSLNLLGEALALRGGLTLNGFSTPSSTAVSASTAPTLSKAPIVSSSTTSTSSPASSSPSTSLTLKSFSSQVASPIAPLAAPPPIPHPALLLPGRPYPGQPTLDEEQLRYLSLAQIQAANQAHLAEVAKLKQQSPHFLTRNYLELAMLVCNTFRGKLFPCPHCRYVTDRRNNLKRHVATMHQTCDKQLECCGVRFSTKASLREHITIFHHNGYSCPFCGRRFCRKALLKRHLSVHSGQKDYTCPSCDYATSHKSNLERHKRIHARLHLMGGDASALGHDIDEEELRRMEEEEEEEDRRRRRQTASMMMMLDEDDDETQDVDMEGQRGDNNHHQHRPGPSSQHSPSEEFRGQTHPWSLPGLMRPGSLSFLSPYPPHYTSSYSQENHNKVDMPISLHESRNIKSQQASSAPCDTSTSENPTDTSHESPHSKAREDVEEELDVENDENGEDTDNANVKENSSGQEREDSSLPDKATKPDSTLDTNDSNNTNNHCINMNNNNNNNEKNIQSPPFLYRPFSTVFSPAGQVRENQPMNLIVSSKHGATTTDITMATRLAHGFAAIPSLQPRF